MEAVIARGALVGTNNDRQEVREMASRIRKSIPIVIETELHVAPQTSNAQDIL